MEWPTHFQDRRGRPPKSKLASLSNQSMRSTCHPLSYQDWLRRNKHSTVSILPAWHSLQNSQRSLLIALLVRIPMVLSRLIVRNRQPIAERTTRGHFLSSCLQVRSPFAPACYRTCHLGTYPSHLSTLVPPADKVRIQQLGRLHFLMDFWRHHLLFGEASIADSMTGSRQPRASASSCLRLVSR